jgi:hypothetical protein
VAAVDYALTVGASESRWPLGSPDSPVNYSQRARLFPQERSVRLAGQPGHRTQSGAPQTGASLAKVSQISSL